MPDLHYVHCTRVIDSCAHIITWRLASGQKPGPKWLRFDSSLSGWVMTQADWPKEVVGRTGRVSERRRFISSGPGARESALAASRVVLDDDKWIVEEADDEDEETGLNIDPSFEEVPSGWLEPCRWNVSGFGRWTRRENTLILEARSWMKCVERLCKGIYGTKCRQLVGDNMCLVLTQCRWRSRLFALIVILRRAAAYILAGDMVIVSRWIMSARATHPADYRNSISHGTKLCTRPMNKHIPEPVLPEPADVMLQTKRNRELVPCQKETHCRRRCRTLRVDTRMMGTLKANRPSPKRALIARKRSERNHARLASLEKDMRRIQTQAASDATTENKTETVPRCQRTLSDEVA